MLILLHSFFFSEFMVSIPVAVGRTPNCGELQSPNRKENGLTVIYYAFSMLLTLTMMLVHIVFYALLLATETTQAKLVTRCDLSTGKQTT